MKDLFATNHDQPEQICEDVHLWRQQTSYAKLSEAVKRTVTEAPFRFMHTPGGQRLNISMTNCGDWGWISTPKGYQYSHVDPVDNQPWPKMPDQFKTLAIQAATGCGFTNFKPNACLINHYKAGQTLTAHQDKNEGDFSQPIVSVSLGMSAHFQIWGSSRQNRPREIELFDGDVMVWGDSARLMYHGVKTNRSIPHPTLGMHRINLTFRQVKIN